MSSDGESDPEFGGDVLTAGAEILVSAIRHGGPDFVGAVFSYSVRNFTRGDVNGDGVVDVSDVVSLLGWLFVAGTTPLTCDDAADMNDDGTLDLADGIYGLTGLFATGGAALPAPWDCDLDETPDTLGCDAFPECP